MAASDIHPLNAQLWRAVEAQHKVSTMRLVDNDLAAQAILERMIDSVKPPFPVDTQGLHWLLATPFRYRPGKRGSRFRAYDDPGVFYGALERHTACAEAGYWRWRFILDSEGLKQLEAHPMTLFQSKIATPGVDLRKAPFARLKKHWTDPADYTYTQDFARQARAKHIGAILYASVRDPAHGPAAAVLTPTAFAKGQVPKLETWYLTVNRSKVIWSHEMNETLVFAWQK
ncbi:MAG: RES family NAD+ phosphorylase [Pseudomonadota bacterium]